MYELKYLPETKKIYIDNAHHSEINRVRNNTILSPSRVAKYFFHQNIYIYKPVMYLI